MRKLIINNDNLKIDDIDTKEIRVKCFVMNDEGKFMLACTSDGCFQLPGGHVEDGEEYIVAVKREILEEAGIELDDDEIVEIFFEKHKFAKNHKNSGKNKLSSIIYYFIKTNKKINLNKTNMTEHEKNAGYTIDFYNLKTMEEKLIQNIKNNPVEIYKIVSQETLTAMKEFKKYHK